MRANAVTGADETARATFEEHPQARLAGDGSLPGRWAWSSHQLWAVPVPLTAPRAAPARPASQPLKPNRTLFIEIMPDATDRLQLENTWLDDGRLFALWRSHSCALLQRTRIRLHRELRGKLYRSCAHLKGHGGVKGALRYIARRQPNYRYVARFDVARYYESMRHDLLLDLLGRMGASSQSRAIVKD